MNDIEQLICRHCGECCGPIPVAHREWLAIRRYIRRMPNAEVERLKRQRRCSLTCPFRVEMARLEDRRVLLAKVFEPDPTNVKGILGLTLGWNEALGNGGEASGKACLQEV